MRKTLTLSFFEWKHESAQRSDQEKDCRKEHSLAVRLDNRESITYFSRYRL